MSLVATRVKKVKIFHFFHLVTDRNKNENARLLKRLEKACRGLVYFSEADAPVEPLHGNNAKDASGYAMLQAAGLDKKQHRQKADFDKFLKTDCEKSLARRSANQESREIRRTKTSFGSRAFRFESISNGKDQCRYLYSRDRSRRKYCPNKNPSSRNVSFTSKQTKLRAPRAFLWNYDYRRPECRFRLRDHDERGLQERDWFSPEK